MNVVDDLFDFNVIGGLLKIPKLASGGVALLHHRYHQHDPIDPRFGDLIDLLLGLGRGKIPVFGVKAKGDPAMGFGKNPLIHLHHSFGIHYDSLRLKVQEISYCEMLTKCTVPITMKKTPKRSRKMIQSVQKAMEILRVVSDGKNHPVPLMEIAQKTGYPKPTCAHLLETLCHDGYAERVSHAEGYRLGAAAYYLTRYGSFEQPLVSLCRPVMRWMERKTHATVILSVLRNRQKFIIAYADTEQNLLREHPSICMDDLYRTATGRAMRWGITITSKMES